ncbi:MAG: glycine cleavage T C-terminal barrel domain-containing protein [Vicinamibacterales bacterium]
MAEHDVLTSGAALVAQPPPGLVRVTGADRASWLQGILTNDVQALADGRGCYAAWLTPQGRMITDAVVLAEDGSLTVEVPASLADGVCRQLAAAVFAEDVELADESGQWAVLGVHGAAAPATVARALAGSLESHELAAWPEFAHASAGGALVTRRDGYGVPGFMLRVPAGEAGLWTSRLRLAGATPVSGTALEFARIEAGRPVFLVDMDADTIPLEAGIEERAISFTKGCYVGQEVIVRVLHRGGGRVARKLVGLSIAGECVPAARAAVRSDHGDVGRVTSAAWSPRLGHGVALAYVHRDAAAPGTRVVVACDGEDVPATVRSFPLNDPEPTVD